MSHSWSAGVGGDVDTGCGCADELCVLRYDRGTRLMAGTLPCQSCARFVSPLTHRALFVVAAILVLWMSEAVALDSNYRRL